MEIERHIHSLRGVAHDLTAGLALQQVSEQKDSARLTAIEVRLRSLPVSAATAPARYAYCPSCGEELR